MPSFISRFIAFVSIAGIVAQSGPCQDAACSTDGQARDTDTVALLQDPDVVKRVIKTEKAPTVDETAKSSVSLQAAFAEYVAMTLFVVIGCGSAMGVCGDPGWVLQVALSFGLAISSLAYAIGHYSGGQINCAVTFALVLAGHCSVVQGLVNFVAQLLGAITGAFILTAMCPEDLDKTKGLGSNDTKGRQGNAFVGEVTMTFLLVFVILETALKPDHTKLAAVAIGFAVFLAHSVLIPLDGCSINPTRSFGPALVRKFFYKKDAGSFEDMWVFWVGPLLGAAGAVVVSKALSA